MSPSLVQSLDRRPDSPGTARSMVRHLFRGRTSAELLSDVELVVSELVTNALLHGDGEITLLLRLEDDAVVVGVQDGGPGHPLTRSVGIGGEEGRGMALVAGIAREWGVRVVDGGDRKEVWAVVSPETTPRTQSAVLPA